MISKQLLRIAFGLALSGCTINQYGPSVTLGEEYSPIVMDVKIDREGPVQEPSAPSSPSAAPQAVDKKTVQKTVKKTTTACVPMPTIPDPPKMDLEELKAHRNDEEKLKELFEKNHSEMYKQFRAVKKNLDAWYKRPDRC